MPVMDPANENSPVATRLRAWQWMAAACAPDPMASGAWRTDVRSDHTGPGGDVFLEVVPFDLCADPPAEDEGRTRFDRRENT